MNHVQPEEKHPTCNHVESRAIDWKMAKGRGFWLLIPFRGRLHVLIDAQEKFKDGVNNIFYFRVINEERKTETEIGRVQGPFALGRRFPGCFWSLVNVQFLFHFIIRPAF